jgi:hypothetical protein
VLSADWDEEVGMCGESDFELGVESVGSGFVGMVIDFFSYVLYCTMRYW